MQVSFFLFHCWDYYNTFLQVANSQTRSRSPSPCSRRFEDSGKSYKEDETNGSGFLQPDQGHHHSRRRRSRSRTASHPHHVDVKVTVVNTSDSQADADASTELLGSCRGRE